MVRDFDLRGCGVSISANPRTWTWNFDGVPKTVSETAQGKLVLAFSPTAFDPLVVRFPADGTDEEIRALRLELTVDRQMRRLLKYVRRGYKWELPSCGWFIHEHNTRFWTRNTYFFQLQQ